MVLLFIVFQAEQRLIMVEKVCHTFMPSRLFTPTFPGQKETYGEVLSYGQTTDWPITTTYVESSGDGEYIIQRGTYRVGPDTKEYPFETIYRKHNGKYLILHEDCDCTPTP